MKRFEKAAARLGAGQAYLFTKPENMIYITGGYTGEGCVFLSAAAREIITDFRYTEQAGQQAPDFAVFEVSAQTGETARLGQLCTQCGVSELFAETSYMTHDAFVAMEKALAPVKLTTIATPAEDDRIVKDEGEIACIRKAAQITDASFDFLVGNVREGMTELEVVGMLYGFFLSHGATGFSFAPIIASGENSSLPHAVAGQRRIRRGDLITFDIGCKVGGYCSDFTRTIAVGGIDPELEKIYNIVLEANLRGLAAVRPGVTGFDVDKAARDHIAANGYGAAFGHSTGHGVGLEIHEAPRLSSRSQDVLKPGMIVTVEPGIYLPGKGGVRIEDLVLVTENGCDVLSHSTKELIII